MYGSAIIEIMRPIKTSINVSRVFAFPTEEFLLKRSRQYECILGVIEVMSLTAEQWCISVNLITACPSSFETTYATTEDCVTLFSLYLSYISDRNIQIYNYMLNKFNNHINYKLIFLKSLIPIYFVRQIIFT